MEHLPPDEQQAPSHSLERETSHPSFLQRTMRTLLTPILLGGAVVATTLPLPVEGDNPTKEERKEEDPILARLRQEIPSLVIDLDSNQYRVREQAQRRLTHVTTEWVRTRQKPFPLLPLLPPTKKHSLEQSQRLQRVLAAHEHEELQLLWRPTMVTIPPQWQGRDRPMLTDVLRELSSQTGYHLVQSRLRTQEELQQSKIAFPEGEQKTFWEAGKVIHDGIGNIEWSARSDNALDCSAVAMNAVTYACPRGAAMALLQRYGESSAFFSITLEPKFLLKGMWALTGEVIAENGRKMDVHFAQRGREESGVYFTLPPVPGVKKALVRVTATISAYEHLVVPIEDLGKQQVLHSTYDGALKYVGYRERGGGEIDGKTVWLVRSTGNENTISWMENMVRCQAFDAQRNPLLWWYSQKTDHMLLHTFVGDPASLRFIVPRRRTEQTMTFEFPSVSLPKQ